jgi:hypothetical protein
MANKWKHVNMSFQCVHECHVGIVWVPHWQHIITLLAGCNKCASTSGSLNKCDPKLETFFECTQIFISVPWLHLEWVLILGAPSSFNNNPPQFCRNPETKAKCSRFLWQQKGLSGRRTINSKKTKMKPVAKWLAPDNWIELNWSYPRILSQRQKKQEAFLPSVEPGSLLSFPVLEEGQGEAAPMLLPSPCWVRPFSCPIKPKKNVCDELRDPNIVYAQKYLKYLEII